MCILMPAQDTNHEPVHQNNTAKKKSTDKNSAG